LQWSPPKWRRSNIPRCAQLKEKPTRPRRWHGTGYQLSMFGLLSVAMAREEGVEVNLLGLNFGIDFVKPALKLPFIGRVGEN
jgi:hypothetical protein